jgi:ketosteroid isomerase-like protein
MPTRSERIRDAFNNLRAESMDILDSFYSPDVVFQDPLGRIEGLSALKKYYARMYENVFNIRFDATDELVQGDKHVLIWSMYLRARGLNKGNEVVLDGNSVIHFNTDDLVHYHRDYFDMGAFVYVHIPIVGYVIRKINARLELPKI